MFKSCDLFCVCKECYRRKLNRPYPQDDFPFQFGFCSTLVIKYSKWNGVDFCERNGLNENNCPKKLDWLDTICKKGI